MNSLTTLLQFLDKSTLSYAGIFGIIDDLVIPSIYVSFCHLLEVIC